MPGRDPEARERSERVAVEIRAVMRQKGLSGAALADMLRTQGMTVPNDMWLSRRLTGAVNLVEPVKVVYGPTDELEQIANALGVDPKRLARAATRADAHVAARKDGPTGADYVQAGRSQQLARQLAVQRQDTTPDPTTTGADSTTPAA